MIGLGMVAGFVVGMIIVVVGLVLWAERMDSRDRRRRAEQAKARWNQRYPRARR